MGGAVPDLSQIGPMAGPDLAYNFRSEVAHLLSRETLGFPGAQPVSFARKHLRELEREDYYVCEKSDGIRALLYFTHGNLDPATNQREEIHYLIDRKNNYYCVGGLHFPKPPAKPDDQIDWSSFYTETILDGELLYDTLPSGEAQLKYLVFDCLVLGGVNLMIRTLDKRLGYFKEKLYQPYTRLCEAFPEDTANFPFKIEEKSFQVSYAAEMMFKDVLPSLMHGHDGLIFTCRGTPYKFGTDEHILKWKPAEENTIDFKLALEFPRLPRESADDDPEFDYDAHPKFELWAHHQGEDRPFATMFATSEEWERMKAWSVQRNDGLHGQIVECHKDRAGRWRFNRFRDDKHDANHISTVESVLESIEDAVGQDELVRVAGQVRKAWKERAAKRAQDERSARRAQDERQRR